MVKGISILVVLLLAISSVFGQINAITETGDEVILYEDGTWIYVGENTNGNIDSIYVNNTVYEKDSSATFLVKSKKLNVGIHIDPKKWIFNKAAEGDAVEYNFNKKGKDLYAILLTEEIQLPLETLKNIAFENARSGAKDVKILKEEYRMVNGIQVIMMQMSGTIQGVKFTYMGYYYTNENGSVQFLSYTSDNLFQDNVEELETLLNGIVEY